MAAPHLLSEYTEEELDLTLTNIFKIYKDEIDSL